MSTLPSREHSLRLVGFLAFAAALLLLPFALTVRYSSMGHRGIATMLSFPDAADTRSFLGVLSATILLVVGVPHQSGVGAASLKRFSVMFLIGLLAFGTANVISYCIRGGPSVYAYGFPFQIRSVGSSSPNVINASSMDYTALWVDIVLAVTASASMGIAQLGIVRRTARVRRAIVIISLALVVYVGTFSFWWLTGKSMSEVKNGKQVREVEVHQCNLMYLTQPIWDPAFWFMEHICGYRYNGYVAAYEDSVFLFVHER
jgi:hypothetical protein